MRAREKKACVWAGLWYGVGMARHGKRVLHETPAEFARAAVVHGTRRWRERAERMRARQEALRNRKMPAHPAPLTDEQWWAKQKF